MAVKKQKLSPFWERVNEVAERPKRRRMGVNLGKISKNSKAGALVVVCDKVLSSGKLMHAVTVAASGFSAGALRGIKSSGGKAISMSEAMKANPTGKDAIIIC